ncbi:MAG: hypothetical protein E5X21_25500 [Mesorhizobium sp.]|nr:MAG: hypothetical protein E5X21_25500 [Mesorhizobium sp.]
MKLVVTKRAPHLGVAGTAVEMTPSQAAYERLRGHVVEPAQPKADGSAGSSKASTGRAPISATSRRPAPSRCASVRPAAN